MRYEADGTLDPSFGFGGKVVTDFGSSHEAAGAIAIQPDGKLVVAGSTRPFGAYDSHPPDFALARYNANGTLDTSFGADGKVSTGFQPGWADTGYGVALAPRGKIVVAGWGLPGASGGPGVIDLARYNADGSLDTSFGGDGTVVSAPVTDSAAFSVVVQPDSKVVVAGYAGLLGLALLRYTASGSLDLVKPLAQGPRTTWCASRTGSSSRSE